MVAYARSRASSREKGFLTSSCCPAFVAYIEKALPELMADKISHNLSPMAADRPATSKRPTPGAKIVFIGPCTAKKMEFQKRETVRPYIDCAHDL